MLSRSTLAALLFAACLVPARGALAQGDYAMPEESAAATAARADRTPEPGAAFGAAAANLVYVPVRFAVSVTGAILTGLTGWLTGGNRHAADDTWNLCRGQAFLTPDILEGREPLRFGPWDTGGR